MKKAIIVNCKRNKSINLSKINTKWSKDKRLYIITILLKKKDNYMVKPEQKQMKRASNTYK